MKSMHRLFPRRKLAIFTTLDFKQALPFTPSLDNLVAMAEVIREVKNIIAKSKNPRVIVLESWLIVDYCVKELLLYGLQLKRFQTEAFRILPDSFESCLKLLDKLKERQSGLPPNPSKKFIKLPFEFSKFFEGKYKKEYDAFARIELEYLQQHYPEAQMRIPEDHIDSPNHRHVPDEWLDVVKKLDKKWFKTARQLNECRNIAAHQYNAETIFKAFNIEKTEIKKLSLLKEKCFELLNVLVGLKTKGKKISKA
jgi:hypothetical protein